MSSISSRLGRSRSSKVRNTINHGTVASCIQMHGALEFKKSDDKQDGRLFFSGYANTANVDRGGDYVRPSAFRAGLKNFMSNPVLFFQHNWGMPIGQITEATVTDRGLFVKGFVMAPKGADGEELYGEWPDFINWIRALVAQNILRTLSVGFRLIDSKPGKMKDKITGKERTVREITKLELLEISLVGLPMNRESRVTPMSFFQKEFGDEVAESLVGCQAGSLEPGHETNHQASVDAEAAGEGRIADAEERQQLRLLYLEKAFIDGRIDHKRFEDTRHLFSKYDKLETDLNDTEDDDDTKEGDESTGEFELIKLSEREEPEQEVELVSLSERGK